LLPKPHKCSRGEECATWKRQQRKLQRLHDEFCVDPSLEDAQVIPQEPDYHDARQSEDLRPTSDAEPSVVASSDVLGPENLLSWDIYVSEDEAGERNHLPLHTPKRSYAVRKPSPTLETTESTAVPLSFGFKTSFPENVDRSIRTQTDSALELPSNLSAASPSVEIFKSLSVGLDDPCRKVLPDVLRTYNIQADWRRYALYIVYGDQERDVGWDELPLRLFKNLDRQGLKPQFMLRRLPPEGPSSGVGLPGMI
jgi:hypothetical protein